MRLIVVLMMTSWCTYVQASQVTTEGAVEDIFVHPGYEAGEVVFKLSSSVLGCEKGFWFKSSDSAANLAESILLSARVTHESVKAIGETTDLWPGSSGKYCRLKRISYSEA